MTLWVVVITRNIRCTESDTGKEVDHPDVVAVFGPHNKTVALARAEQFNRSSTLPVPAEAGPDIYWPVRNAPAFIDQEHWLEHWASVCPLNDIEW
jgi:hypothetical protein